MDGQAPRWRQGRGCMANALAIVTTEFAMPAILAAASPKARKGVLEFFGASIRNENTRKAYMTACAAFFDFLADNDVTALEDIGPLHGAAYLEAMKGAKPSVAKSSTWRPLGCSSTIW
jgi:hypothetical protein